MARAPLVLETHGKISRRRLNGVPTAFARYRDTDGKTRKVQRSGRTLAEAEQNLKEALKNRVRVIDEHAVLTRESTINDLVREWLDEARASGEYAAATLRTYDKRATKLITPGIGEVRLQEVTVSILDRFVKLTTKNNGPGSSRTVRSILSNAFSMAVRLNLVDFNMVANTAKVPATKNTPQAPSLDQVQRLLPYLRDYDAALIKAGRTVLLHDLISLYVATGARTAELLALKWENVEFTDSGAILSIESTLIVGEDNKLTRQPFTKSDSGMRRLSIPKAAAVVLHNRHLVADYEMVFPSSTGTYRWPHNLRREWREAIDGTEFEGLTPTSFRKAVATLLRDEMGIVAARDQLGHSDERVTRSHYAARLAVAPDATGALEKFFQSAE